VTAATAVDGLVERAGRRLLAPGPAARLAVLRVLTGGFAVVYLAAFLSDWWGMAAFPERRFDPVGLFAPLDQPLPAPVAHALLLAAVAGAGAFTVGWRFRVTGPAFAVLLLASTTFRNSWGQVWHTDNLLALHVAVIGCAPSAAVWSFDDRRRRRARSSGNAGPAGRAPAAIADHARFGFPVRLVSIVTACTYFVAGYAKLRNTGVMWAGGYVLRNQVAYDAVRKAVIGADHSPFAEALLAHAWLFVPMAWVALGVELGAPAALAHRTARRVWALAAWTFHAGVYLLMHIAFPYQLSGIAFASLFPVERIVPGPRVARTVPPCAH
jgi:hypothetical protein